METDQEPIGAPGSVYDWAERLFEAGRITEAEFEEYERLDGADSLDADEGEAVAHAMVIQAIWLSNSDDPTVPEHFVSAMLKTDGYPAHFTLANYNLGIKDGRFVQLSAEEANAIQDAYGRGDTLEP